MDEESKLDSRLVRIEREAQHDDDNDVGSHRPDDEEDDAASNTAGKAGLPF